MSGLTPFGDGIWIADGPDVRDMGIMFTTRMTVVKLADGGLWVESPVALSPEAMERIRDLGPVTSIVASTQRHVWRLTAWHELYPGAELWAPADAPLTLGDGRLPVKDVFTDTPAPGWAKDLEQLAFRGSSLLREVIFFHRRSRSLVIGDLIQVHRILRGRPLRNLLVRLSGTVYPRGGVGLDIRMSFRNRALARESLERLMSWDFDRVIIAHGPCVEEDARSFILDAFRWLIE